MKLLLSLVLALSSLTATAQSLKSTNEKSSALDEMDPFTITAQQLNKMDKAYEKETGLDSHLDVTWGLGCVQMNCEIYAQVVKSQQKLYLYIHGQLTATWPVSTGIPGRETPLLNSHPDGRIYEAYTSTKFPGGDFQGLGNMPYAVFIQGGFAIHGTGEANWPKLGTKASHGCIRIHPDNAKYFNGLVRSAGTQNVWISVQE